MSELPSYDLLVAQAGPLSRELRSAAAAPDPPPNLRLRNAAVIAGGASILAVYGGVKWWEDGFNRRFDTQNEGWFGRDTEAGGIDKLGHVFTTYFAARQLVPIFEAVGNRSDRARWLAAWTAWGAMAGVEVLDGFSKQYRFSREDFIANSVGAFAGYWLETNPRWDDVIDFRLAYRQSEHSDWDPAGDYSGQRFLLVAKADGIPALRDKPVLRYLEVFVGYGAPGYDVRPPFEARPVRQTFAGVSVNLARVLADGFYEGRRSTTRTQRAAENLFEFIQFPAAAYARRELR